MKGWRLSALLALRRRDEETARGALGQALSEEALRRARRDACSSALAAHGRLLEGAGRTLAAGACEGAGALQADARFLERLRGEASALVGALLAAEADLERAEAGVAGRRDALARARSGVGALERHRERWKSARRRERERREESEAEDLVSARAAAPWPAPARTRS